MSGRPFSEFQAKVDARLRAEQGWFRWAIGKAVARVTVGWRLRLYYWQHPEALRQVSQEAFDIIAADKETLAAIAMEAASAGETAQHGSTGTATARAEGIAQRRSDYGY